MQLMVVAAGNTSRAFRNLGTTGGSTRPPVTRGTGHSTRAPSALPCCCSSRTSPCVLACQVQERIQQQQISKQQWMQQSSMFHFKSDHRATTHCATASLDVHSPDISMASTCPKFGFMPVRLLLKQSAEHASILSTHNYQDQKKYRAG